MKLMKWLGQRYVQCTVFGRARNFLSQIREVTGLQESFDV